MLMEGRRACRKTRRTCPVLIPVLFALLFLVPGALAVEYNETFAGNTYDLTIWEYNLTYYNASSDGCWASISNNWLELHAYDVAFPYGNGSAGIITQTFNWTELELDEAGFSFTADFFSDRAELSLDLWNTTIDPPVNTSNYFEQGYHRDLGKYRGFTDGFSWATVNDTRNGAITNLYKSNWAVDVPLDSQVKGNGSHRIYVFPNWTALFQFYNSSLSQWVTMYTRELTLTETFRFHVGRAFYRTHHDGNSLVARGQIDNISIQFFQILDVLGVTANDTTPNQYDAIRLTPSSQILGPDAGVDTRYNITIAKPGGPVKATQNAVQYYWDLNCSTAGLSPGVYNVSVVAYDLNGNATDSSVEWFASVFTVGAYAWTRSDNYESPPVYSNYTTVLVSMAGTDNHWSVGDWMDVNLSVWTPDTNPWIVNGSMTWNGTHWRYTLPTPPQNGGYRTNITFTLPNGTAGFISSDPLFTASTRPDITQFEPTTGFYNWLGALILFITSSSVLVWSLGDTSTRLRKGLGNLFLGVPVSLLYLGSYNTVLLFPDYNIYVMVALVLGHLGVAIANFIPEKMDAEERDPETGRFR